MTAPASGKVLAKPRPLRKKGAAPKGEPLFEIPSDLITPDAAAELLCIEPGTVKRWAQDRRIDHYRTPTGEIRFSKKDLAGAMTFLPAFRPEPHRRGSGS